MPGSTWFQEWLTGAPAVEAHHSIVPLIASVVVAVLGILVGALFFYWNTFSAENLRKRFAGLHTILNRKYWIDELYEKAIQGPYEMLGDLVDAFDKYVVQGIVRLIQVGVAGLGRLTSYVQNGQVQNYALALVVGVIIIAAVAVWMGGGTDVWASSTN